MALLALATTGCMIKRTDYTVPDVPLPSAFKNTPATPAPPESPLLKTEHFAWWTHFEQPTLNALVNQALAHNADLKIAAARMAQMAARSDQASGSRLPTFSLPFEARTESPANGIGTTPAGQSPSTQHQYQMSLRADWRVDLWGEKQAGFESADLQWDRAQRQQDDTRRTLINQVVQRYIDVLALNERVYMAALSEQAVKELLAATEARFAAGDATQIEVNQQRSAVFTVRATLPEIHRQRDEALNQLAFLVGTTASELRISPEEGLDTLRLPAALPAVPAQLVLRRPDVRVMEARLKSADADIDVARARLLPPLDLSAQIGYGSLVMSQLFLSHTLFWNTVVGLSATLFDGGQRAREIDYAKAVHEEMVQTYIRVLYNAVRETEDALSGWKNHSERLESQAIASGAARQAWEDLQEAGTEGEVDTLTILNAERVYQRAEEERIQIHKEKAKSIAAFFSALWEGDVQSTRPQANATAHGAWLAQLSGLHDLNAIRALQADLPQRFATLFQTRELSFRRPENDRTQKDDKGQLYHAFVQSFETEQEVKDFCTALQANLIQCHPVPTQEVATRSAVSFAHP